MFENKKLAILLALGEILLLALLAGYPVIREQLSQSGRKEISLEEQQNSPENTIPEKREGESLPHATEWAAVSNPSALHELPEIILCLEEDSPSQEETRRKENISSEENSFSQGGSAQGEDLTRTGDLSTAGDLSPTGDLSPAQTAEPFQVSPWMSQEGICYFFLPGFARGRGLILTKAEGGSIQIGEKQIKEGDVLREISEGSVYTLSLPAPDGDKPFQVRAVFLYSSELPVLCVSTLSGSMELVDADKENQEEGDAVLYSAAGELLYAGGMESIRGRGNSTWGLSKKPYQIRLSREADLFGMGQAKSWNLLANGYDETRLRNRIVLELASRLGMRYVPGGQMIDLYLNGTYQGNYFLTEKIRVDENGVAIRDMDELVEDAYSAQEREKLTLCQNEDGTRKWADTGLSAGSQEELSGGYLLERELISRFKTEISGFMTDQGDCYTLQSPLYASQEQVDYIADLMQEFQDACQEEDGVHPVTGKHYSEYIDMDSFVQKYLVEEISKNYDGGVTSSFFYKPQDSVSTRIFAGPVWDYDVVFGNCNLDRIASNPLGITKLNNHIYGTELFVWLYEKEDFYQQVVTMYEEKALPYLNALLDSGIDRMAEESRDSARMDSIRWEDLENRYQYYEDYDNDIRYLKYFVEKRRDFLSSVWLEGELWHNVSFVVDGDVWQISCVKDGEIPGTEPLPFRYSFPSLFIGWTTKQGVPYDAYKPVYEDMTFYASWMELPLLEETAGDKGEIVPKQ